MIWPTRTLRSGSGVTTTTSPGEKAGAMLPDSTVTGRYKPVRGSKPSPTSATQATASAARASRSTHPRSAAPATLLPVLEIPAGIGLPLLVGRSALRAGERVGDRGRLVLERVAGAAWQRQRHPQAVRAAGSQRRQAAEADPGADHRSRGDEA